MLKVAVIGCGNISGSHIKAYLEFPELCQITALCDIYPEKAEKRKAEFGLAEARIYASHEELLASESVDVISVCTPPYVHSEIAVHGLEAGSNVLVEKPMAASLEECDQMLEAEKRTGKTLGVIAQNRFRTPFMNLKKVLDSGLIGKVLHTEIDSFWWRGHCYYDLWWRGSWEKEGGGCTLNHAVHHIDMLGWMMGRPDKVTAVVSNAAHDNAEVEDISIAIMKYPEGRLAQVTSSVIHYGEQQAVKFQGEYAAVSVPWEVHASVAKGNGFPDPNPELEQKIQEYYDSLPELQYEKHPGEIQNFLEAVERGERPFITGEDGRLTIELITAIYEAGFTEKTVELPLKKDDPFYTAEGILKNVRHFHEKNASVENFTDEAISLGREV